MLLKRNVFLEENLLSESNVFLEGNASLDWTLEAETRWEVARRRARFRKHAKKCADSVVLVGNVFSEGK